MKSFGKLTTHQYYMLRLIERVEPRNTASFHRSVTELGIKKSLQSCAGMIVKFRKRGFLHDAKLVLTVEGKKALKEQADVYMDLMNIRRNNAKKSDTK